MKYRIVIDGEFASLNEFIDANRTGKGKWNKGNQMKQHDQKVLALYIAKYLKNVKISNPVHLTYSYYCKNKRRDKDNISGYFHKIFQDSLVTCGVIEDDSWKYIVGFTDEFFVDKERPRVEVLIKEVSDYE